MNELLASKVFAIALTLGVYVTAQAIYRRWQLPLLNPVFLSILTLMAALAVLRIPYETYFAGGQIISFFLGPAVVALGVPLYQQLDVIQRQGKAILLAVTIGSVSGILSAAGLAMFLGASRAVVISLAPKSVTTPIAMEISARAGGIPVLTAVIVIATGIVGAMIGPGLLRVCGIHSPTAVGLALGTAAHGLGTARALEEGATQGAMSGLALCLNGILTALLVPLLLPIILKFLP